MSKDNDLTVGPDTSMQIVLCFQTYEAHLEQERPGFQRALTDSSTDQVAGPETQHYISDGLSDYQEAWSATLALPDEHHNVIPPDQHQGDFKRFFWRPTNSTIPGYETVPPDTISLKDCALHTGETDHPNDLNSGNSSPLHGSGSSESHGDSSRESKEYRHTFRSEKKKRKTSRSRRGCMTCRQKKKKCDENWQLRKDSHGNTVKKCDRCSGRRDICYLPDHDQPWRSGAARQENLNERNAFKHGILRSTVGRVNAGANTTLPVRAAPRISLYNPPPLLPGVGNADIQEGLVDFFWDKTSRVMSMRDPDANPFSTVLLPMAIKHEGLMHTVLWMAAYHKSWEHPSPRLDTLMATHYENANLCMLVITCKAKSGQSLTDCEFALLIVYFRKLILSEAVEKASHKDLLDSIASILPRHRFDNASFKDFANEFILYHGTLDAITTMSRPISPIHREASGWPAFVTIPNTQLEKVYLDGVVWYINEIVKMRNIIRPRWDRQERYALTGEIIVRGNIVDGQLREKIKLWKDDPSRRISSLYAVYAYLFLWRTVRESYPHPHMSLIVDLALAHLEAAMEDKEVIGIALPIVFMIGCAAFRDQTYFEGTTPIVIHAGQRQRVAQAFDVIRNYRRLPDTDRAYYVVRKVWEKMDSDKDEDVISSWHWEEIMKQEGIDGPFA